MPIPTPDTAAEVDKTLKIDVQRELPGSNPFLKQSFLGALTNGIARRIFSFYFALKEAAKEALPDTAVLNLVRWSTIYGITRDGATRATGEVVFTGTDGTPIPVSTLMVDSDGNLYVSTQTKTVAAGVIAVATNGLTSDGAGTATFKSAAAHKLGSNVLVTITGAGESEYNVTEAEITIVDDDEFTYQISGTPSTPASGTPVAAHTSVAVPVSADVSNFGEGGNKEVDDTISIQSPIPGVDTDGRVNATGLSGGSDQQDDDSLRDEMLDKIRDPVAHFNVAEITAVARTIPGVTRVFVQEVTPAVGQVTIYFMRDNDASPIPATQDVANVDAVIQAIRPANTESSDVIVAAPTEDSIEFTFSSISPDTSTMRSAINASLLQFFAESTEVGEDIVEEAYTAAIFNTIDLVTGEHLLSFTLSTVDGVAPADVTIAAGAIGTRGAVTYL